MIMPKIATDGFSYFEQRKRVQDAIDYVNAVDRMPGCLPITLEPEDVLTLSVVHELKTTLKDRRVVDGFSFFHFKKLCVDSRNPEGTMFKLLQAGAVASSAMDENNIVIRSVTQYGFWILERIDRFLSDVG